MKKIIGIAMVFFLLMGCAHGPQKIPGDMTPTHDDGSQDTELDKAKEKKKSRWEGWEPGLEIAILLLLALPIAFVIGFIRSFD